MPAPPDDSPGNSSAPTDLAAGERYIPGAQLGRGGFGRVIEATDTGIGRSVARLR